MTLKTWEVYKIALEKPKAKFRRINTGKIYYVGPRDLFYHLENRTSCHMAINEDWELFRESVDFMAAISNGKTIRSEFWGQDDFICTSAYENTPMRLTVREIKGKWYIEDDAS